MVTRRPPTKPNQTPGAQCDIKEASRITGLTAGSIYVYVRRGIIPFHKSNFRLTFNPEELRRWRALRSKDMSITAEEALANWNQKRKKK